MAKRKKSRTPAPPKRTSRPPAPRSDGTGAARQVQAPKVRTGKRRTQSDEERRSRLILYGLALSGILGLVIAIVLVFAFRGGGGGGTSAGHFDGPSVDFAKMIGVRTGDPAWSRGWSGLDQRLKPSGLTPLGTEGQVLHIHSHLDIYDNGKHITVPKWIGLKLKNDGNLDFIAELHTHSADGVIHTESPAAHTFSLGQFFGAWGVFLSKKCVGGLCGTAKNPLRMYVDGKLVEKGDPVKLVLQEHQEIVFVYGTPPAKIPSSYKFPAGE